MLLLTNISKHLTQLNSKMLCLYGKCYIFVVAIIEYAKDLDHFHMVLAPTLLAYLSTMNKGNRNIFISLGRKNSFLQNAVFIYFLFVLIVFKNQVS